MPTTDDTIARLKAEAAEAKNQDFQTGHAAGLEWADNSHFIDIRELEKAYIDQILTKGLPKVDIIRWLRRETVASIRDLDAEEFAEMLGGTPDHLPTDDMARGFLKGVSDFVEQAKANVPQC
jgi:hypothetical protein